MCSGKAQFVRHTVAYFVYRIKKVFGLHRKDYRAAFILIGGIWTFPLELENHLIFLFLTYISTNRNNITVVIKAHRIEAAAEREQCRANCRSQSRQCRSAQ